MLNFEIDEIKETFSLKIGRIKPEEQYAFLKDVEKSFKGGDRLAQLIYFEDDVITVKLPLRFYYLGGKAFKNDYPLLEKIPSYFFTKMKNIDKWFGKQIKWKT